MRDYVSKRIGNGPESVGNVMKYVCYLEASSSLAKINGR